MASQGSHLNPVYTPKYQYGHEEKHQLEGLKKGVVADTKVVENCFTKCALNFKEGSFAASENACVGRCFNKYLDTQLLLEKEILFYTTGNPRI